MERTKTSSLAPAVAETDVAEAGFEAALRHNRMRLFRVALLMLGSREDAEDATQWVLLKALESRGSFRGEAGVYTWLYRILVNHCKDFWKGRSRWARWIEPGDEQRMLAVPETRPGPEHELVERERDERVRSAIASLDPRSREILVLRHYEDMSYEDLARVLGCPVGTVRSRLSAARGRLREQLCALGGMR